MILYFARDFDRDRNFESYWKNDRVGAAWWVIKTAEAAHANSDVLELIRALFDVPLTSENEAIIKEKLSAHEDVMLNMGRILSLPPGEITDKHIDQLGWKLPARLPAPVITGNLKVEPADESFKTALRETSGQMQKLQKMIRLEAGANSYSLVGSSDPLESVAADLSAFEGAYQVSVRGWPDGTGRIYVTETGPVINLPGYQPMDFAQGRLFDNGIKDDPVVLRINANQQISIVDKTLQEELRPFIGTGVILYGKRIIDSSTGSVSLKDIFSNFWVLCRLTDVKDDTYQLPPAPLPSIQKNICLCIGGTPPWNWEGPNIRTHLLTPIHTIGLLKTTERRFVFGKFLPGLPNDINNPLPDVKRVVQVITATERDIDVDAHWATRLAPFFKLHRDLSGIAHLTSAFSLVKTAQPS